ncbi:hypothetical protein JCM10213_002595 [Rhodosporidiobolus nylandii]
MPDVDTGECAVCGIVTKQRCGACAEAGAAIFFCSREHQKLIWSAHKRFCGANSKPFRFPLLSPAEAELAKKRMNDSAGYKETMATTLRILCRCSELEQPVADTEALTPPVTSYSYLEPFSDPNGWFSPHHHGAMTYAAVAGLLQKQDPQSDQRSILELGLCVQSIRSRLEQQGARVGALNERAGRQLAAGMCDQSVPFVGFAIDRV